MAQQPQVIHFATDFSPYPGGRRRTDGPASAQAFREDHLAPALARGGPVVVSLDGIAGTSTPFIDEAFGALARSSEAPGALARLRVESADPDLQPICRRVSGALAQGKP